MTQAVKAMLLRLVGVCLIAVHSDAEDKDYVHAPAAKLATSCSPSEEARTLGLTVASWPNWTLLLQRRSHGAGHLVILRQCWGPRSTV